MADARYDAALGEQMQGASARRAGNEGARMNEASGLHVPAWDEPEADAIEVAPAGSRRLLLAGAGGLMLAASALILPDWLEEAEAREGALDGARGGRRGKDHRGRNRRKRRTHGDKKDRDKNTNGNDAPRGLAAPPGVRSTAVTVINQSEKPINCVFYLRTKTGPDSYGLPIANEMPGLDPDTSFRYDPDRDRVGVLVTKVDGPYDLFVDMRSTSDASARASVTSGINIEPQRGIFGATQIPEQTFAEREAKEKQRYVLLRLDDDSLGRQRIEWLLTIR